MEYQKTIDITITLTGENTFRLDFNEPESGDHTSMEGYTDDDGSGSELVEKIGEEILGWVSLLQDERDNAEPSRWARRVHESNPYELEAQLKQLRREYEDAVAEGADEDRLISLSEDIAELEQRVNFAWQDDEEVSE